MDDTWKKLTAPAPGVSIPPSTCSTTYSVPAARKLATPQVVRQGMERLFSAYRKDEYADAKGFLVQLGTILEEYTDPIVEYVTHPSTGIQRRLKFPPSLAEVVEACDTRVRMVEAQLEQVREENRAELRKLWPAANAKFHGATKDNPMWFSPEVIEDASHMTIEEAREIADELGILP